MNKWIEDIAAFICLIGIGSVLFFFYVGLENQCLTLEPKEFIIRYSQKKGQTYGLHLTGIKSSIDSRY